MSAGDMVVNNTWATVECDGDVHSIICDSGLVTLVNIGAKTVYAQLNAGSGDLDRTGEQHSGEIPILAGATVPCPIGTRRVRHQCTSGEVSKLWVIPRAV